MWHDIDWDRGTMLIQRNVYRGLLQDSPRGRSGRYLGLHFGAYDFLRTEDGTWHFLEVNATGQWLYVETGASLPIAEAFARLLWDDAADEPGFRLAPYTDASLESLMAPFHDGVLDRARASGPSRIHRLDP
jgi:hypothetical protein